jgi:hypothetical protein
MFNKMNVKIDVKILLLFVIFFVNSLVSKLPEELLFVIFLGNVFLYILLGVLCLRYIKRLEFLHLFFIASLIVSAIYNFKYISGSGILFTILTIVVAINATVTVDKASAMNVALNSIKASTTLIVFLMFLIPPELVEHKEFLGLEVIRYHYSFISLSSLAIYSGLGYCLASCSKKQRYLWFWKIFFIVVIFSTGKFSILLSLIFINLFYFAIKQFKYNVFKITFLLLLFLSSFYLVSIGGVVLDKILSGRLAIWKDYFDYLSSVSYVNLLIGNGLTSESRMVSFIFHPHNQYLYVFFYGGFLFVFSYFVICQKMIKESLNNVALLKLTVFLLLIQITDDYLILPGVFITVFLIFSLARKT